MATEQDPSAEYARIKAGLDAWEMWESLETDAKLNVILEHFEPKQWLEPDELKVLLAFHDEPPGRWAQIKLRYKEIGGNPFDLEKTAQQILCLRRNGTDPYSDDTADATFDPFIFTDAHAILAAPLIPRRWLLPGIIADGLTIMGGSPKGGKSYLAYALALATAHYGQWCNYWPVERGKVVYISLEDDENDSHLRLHELDPDLSLEAGKLLFVHGGKSMPVFGAGLLEWLEETLKLHQPRLLIIDPISYLYVLKRNGSQFEETKDMLFPLRWLGREYKCAIVCLDHRRKRSREDVSMVDTLYGSVAKQAVADGLIMVNKEEDELELDLTIRAGKTQKLYMSFVFEGGRCFLSYKGEEDQTANYGDFRTRVIGTVHAALSPLGVPEIIAELKLPDTRQARNNITQILYRAMKTKEVEKTTRGRYVKGEME
jgi:hypothetical protein